MPEALLLILLILVGTEFLSMVKGSWTENDGAGSGISINANIISYWHFIHLRI